MRSLQMMLLRFLVTFWCGAATLYVLTSVREVTSDQLSAEAKNVLPLLRFPLYYGFGFVCVTVSCLLVAIIPVTRLLGRMRRRLMLMALIAVLVAMIGDFFFVYRPLHAMLSEGADDAERFARYHDLSKWINAAEMLVCYSCAVVLCWSSNHE